MGQGGREWLHEATEGAWGEHGMASGQHGGPKGAAGAGRTYKYCVTRCVKRP